MGNKVSFLKQRQVNFPSTLKRLTVEEKSRIKDAFDRIQEFNVSNLERNSFSQLLGDNHLAIPSRSDWWASSRRD